MRPLRTYAYILKLTEKELIPLNLSLNLEKFPHNHYQYLILMIYQNKQNKIRLNFKTNDHQNKIAFLFGFSNDNSTDRVRSFVKLSPGLVASGSLDYAIMI